MIEKIQSIINGYNREVPLVRLDELWKRICEIPGYENIKSMYWISSFGRIYSEKSGYLTTTISHNYSYIMLYTNNIEHCRVRVHRLVMIAFAYFIGCEDYEVNHKDGDKSHNWLSNLEWSTRKENMDHAVNNGLAASCENSYRATITNEQAIKICELLTTGDYQPNQISTMIGCSTDVVDHILHHNAWQSLSINYIFHRRVSRTFSNSELLSIINFILENNIAKFKTKADYYRTVLSNINIEYIPKVHRTVLECIIINPYEYLNKLNNCIC